MNEKHFGLRLPKADYEMLAELAKNDRSTVAQQVRQAVARYVALVEETSRMRKRMLTAYDSWAEIIDNACESMEMSGLHAESSYKELKRLHAEMVGLMT